MAEDNNTAESDTGKGPSNARTGTPNPSLSYSRKIIVKHFTECAELITIQLTDTILRSPTDQSQGAERFRALMRMLLSSSSHHKKPVLIWVARDLSQLRHVVDTTKSEDQDLFDLLAPNAIYAEAKPSASLYQDLGQGLKKAATGSPYQTLTLHTDNKAEHRADRYAVYGHCDPEKKGIGWDDGPICEPISGLSNILFAPADDLHLAHQLLAGNIKSVQTERAVKNLEGSGIYPNRLENLIS